MFSGRFPLHVARLNEKECGQTRSERPPFASRTMKAALSTFSSAPLRSSSSDASPSIEKTRTRAAVIMDAMVAPRDHSRRPKIEERRHDSISGRE
jgi:hypothetical protein